MAYPHAKVAIEYNGEEFHSSEEDREADSERRAWLERHGWTVIVIDKDSFTDEAIAMWIEEIRTALGDAQRPPRRWYARVVIGTTRSVTRRNSAAHHEAQLDPSRGATQR